MHPEKPTHYLFHVKMLFEPKNKLQKAILAAMKERNGTLIEAHEYTDFILELKAQIEKLCEDHPRCYAIPFQDLGTGKDYIVYGAYPVTIQLIKGYRRIK